MTPMPKAKPWRSKKYREGISSLPCIICNRQGPNDPHHLRALGNGGIGQKPDDCWCIPLCRKHHNEIHSLGAGTFQKKYGVDLNLCLLLVCQEWIKKVE